MDTTSFNSMHQRIERLKSAFVAQTYWEKKRVSPKTPFLRVETDLAKALMLENTSVIIEGKVKHFLLRSLGLGVWEVTIDTSVPCSTSNRVWKNKS